VSGAFVWGVIAASSLLIGALIVVWKQVEQKTLGLIMAFGAGVLISAVAYELIADAIEEGVGTGRVALGLFAGALTFFLGDWYIDRMGGENRKRSQGTGVEGGEGGGSSLSLTLGIVLDGIPESITLGLTLLTGTGVSAAMLTAIFLSNLPESMAATTGFMKDGRSRRWIITLWLGIIAVSGIASLAGYGLFDDASPATIAFVLAFAGGAVLTMLADTMMPEAFEYGGKLVGLLTTLGFAVSVAIVALEHA
jgi:ZIP family zinc transporter